MSNDDENVNGTNKEEDPVDETRYRAMTIIVLLMAAIGVIGVMAPEAMAADNADKLTFTLQPYLWAPTIDADLKLSAPDGSTGEPEIEVKPDDYLENLDIGLIVTAMARKGKWSFTADLVYMEVSSSENTIKHIDFGGPRVASTVNLNVNVDMKSFISTFGGGYQVIDGPRLKMDLVAGLRYLWMESEVDWNGSVVISGPGPGESFPRSGRLKEDGDAWNGIGGIRGEILLGDGNWFIPFYGDVGTGDSDITWSLFSGIGYALTDRFHAMIGFRHMEWDNDDDEVVQQVSVSGPVLGARFNF